MSRGNLPPETEREVETLKRRVTDLERLLRLREKRAFLEHVPTAFFERELGAGKQDLLSSTTSIPSPGQPGMTAVDFSKVTVTPGFEGISWTSSEPSRAFVRVSGLWLCTFAASVDHHGAGGRYWEIADWADPDDEFPEAAVTATGLNNADESAGSDLHSSGAIVTPLTEGHFLELRCWQTSGTTLTTGESPMPKMGLALLSTELDVLG